MLHISVLILGVSQFAHASLPQFPHADTSGKEFRTNDGASASSTNFLSIINNQDSVIKTNEAVHSPNRDCDAASEKGRKKIDSRARLLWVCVNSGWVFE
jgi:hypothetical protein